MTLDKVTDIYLFSCTCGIRKFPGQGLNPSHSFSLHHSCSNAGALTHCTSQGSNPCHHKDNTGFLTHCATAGTLRWLFILFYFLGLHLWHMKVPRQLQLLACTIATAMQDLSCICDLHHSSQKHWNP